MQSDQTEQPLDTQATRQRIDELNERAWQTCDSDPAGAAEGAELTGRLSREGAVYMRGLGWSLLTLGRCAIRRGEYSKARTGLLEAGELLAQCGDRRGEAAALGALGNIYSALAEYPAALENHRASLEISRSTGNGSGEASALTNIGRVFNDLGEYAQALEQYRASLAIYQEIGNRTGEASARGNIGSTYRLLGEYAESLENHQASLLINREIGSLRGEANALGNIGNVHYARGGYPEALEHYQACLRIVQEIGDRRGEANMLGNIGGVHHVMGEHQQALEYFHADLRINQETGIRGGEASALNNLGSVHFALDQFPLALERHLAALAIAEEIGDRAGQIDGLIGSARARSATGEFPAALVAFQSAVEIAHTIGSRTSLAHALLALGHTHAAMGAPEPAIAVLHQVLALAVELGERTQELQASALISEQYERIGDAPQALRHLRRHLELQTLVFSDETRRTVHNLQTAWQMEVAKKEAEIERLRNIELKQAFENLDRAHAELKSAQSQLVQSEKMASLGQLTAGIAHEINNPITFVSSSIGPLRRDLAQIHGAIDELGGTLPPAEYEAFCQEHELEEVFEEMGQLLTSIDSGARRTADIVAGLRSFSRLDEGGLKRVDLHEGLDAALTILRGTVSEGIELAREYGDLPGVDCYPAEINQVFMNLLANAIKAIKGEGRVRVITKSHDGNVSITISDTGVGMTPEVQARIFEPFFTTRDVGEGKGLGLSIAWGIVEKHGGTIEVESAPGAGSRFIVSLPVSPVSPE